jgi:hypothetical protein
MYETLNYYTHPSLQDGFTALHYADSGGYGGVVEALPKAGCEKDIQTKV